MVVVMEERRMGLLLLLVVMDFLGKLAKRCVGLP